jgi:hypothetical protein
VCKQDPYLYNKVSHNILLKVKDYKNKSKNLALEPDLTLIMAQSRYSTRQGLQGQEQELGSGAWPYSHYGSVQVQY